jgi:hypothetical protein
MVRADEAAPLQARAVGQPNLRAQGLKALHGWLTCVARSPAGHQRRKRALVHCTKVCRTQGRYLYARPLYSLRSPQGRRHSKTCQPVLAAHRETAGRALMMPVEFLIRRSQNRIHFLHKWYELVEVL